MIITEGNKIIITIDNNEVDEYLGLYFNKYPRRRKKPIERSIPPSLNQWSNMHRQAKNNLKQNWNDFGVWLIDKYGYTDLGIERCKMTYTYYFHTRHKRDMSNFVCKWIEDSLVESGLLVDDNYDVVNPLILEYGGYDKENPRMIITIERLDLD